MSFTVDFVESQVQAMRRSKLDDFPSHIRRDFDCAGLVEMDASLRSVDSLAELNLR